MRLFVTNCAGKKRGEQHESEHRGDGERVRQSEEKGAHKKQDRCGYENAPDRVTRAIVADYSAARRPRSRSQAITWSASASGVASTVLRCRSGASGGS